MLQGDAKEAQDRPTSLRKGESLRQDEDTNKYLDTEFLEKVSKRGSEIIEVTGKSSGASVGAAICDHMKYWFYGTECTSMAVIPDKAHYEVDKDLCYSYPVKISKEGKWEII